MKNNYKSHPGHKTLSAYTANRKTIYQSMISKGFKPPFANEVSVSLASKQIIRHKKAFSRSY